VTGPELLAFAVVVDFTQLGALLLVAAAEAVGEPRRLSVVGVVGGDVTAMTAFVRLHAASAVDRARVAAGPLFRAPVTDRQRQSRDHSPPLSTSSLKHSHKRYTSLLLRIAGTGADLRFPRHKSSNRCHYCLLCPRLPSQHQIITALGRYQFILLGEQRHSRVNDLPIVAA